MNICMVAYSFYETDNRVRRYSEFLAGEGHRVDVFCLKQPQCVTGKDEANLKVFHLQERIKNEKAKPTYATRILSFFLKALMQLTIRHLRNPYQVVHIHSVPDFLVFAAVVPKLFRL